MRNFYSVLKRKVLNFGRPKNRKIKHVCYRGLNFLVFANEDVGWRIIRKKNFEKMELKIVEDITSIDDICLDIGANIGLYSIFLAKKAHMGHVYSYEPVGLNKTLLEANVFLNDIENVTPKKMVLKESPGLVEFSESVDGAFSSIHPTGRKLEKGRIYVDSCTIDEEFYNKGISLGTVKIDVEGAELLVLKGAKKILSEKELRPNSILVELGSKNMKQYDCSEKDVIDFMGEFGYKPYGISKKGLEEGWTSDEFGENVLFLPRE